MSRPPGKAPRLAGRLLVATPALEDPNFQRTIIYLARHNQREGTLGYVMNRPLLHTLGDVAVSKDIPDDLRDLPMYWGGPVQAEKILLAVFQRGRSDEHLTCQVGLKPDAVRPFLRLENTWVRAFAGFSGWGAGQLKGEMEESSWRIAPPHPALFDPFMLPGLWNVLSTGDERWRLLMPYLQRGVGLN